MAGFNRVIIMGNLTRDPDHKQLSSGQVVCRLGLASNRQYRNRQSGELVQEVCYVDIDVWGPQAESCRQYLAKGRPVLVEGRLKFDSWQDQEGNMRSKHSIVADRVVFMSSSQPSVGEDIGVSAGADVERMQSAMLDQAQATAGKKPRSKKSDEFAAAKTEHKKSSSTADVAQGGEVTLPDDPPFQDDLPF